MSTEGQAAEPNAHPSAELMLFRVHDQVYRWADVQRFAWFCGRSEPFRQAVAARISTAAWWAALGAPLPQDDLEQAMDDWRYRHALLSAEQTNQWLATRGLTQAALQAWLVRDLALAEWERRGRPRSLPTVAAPDLAAAEWPEAVLGAFLPDLVRLLLTRVLVSETIMKQASLADELLGWAQTEFCARHGVAPAQLPAFLQEHALTADFAFFLGLEARYERCSREVAGPEHCQRRIAGFRHELLWVDFEWLRFPALAAAREAYLCASVEHDTLALVGARAGCACQRTAGYSGDLPGALRQTLTSASPGECLPPEADGAGGYVVRRLLNKREPSVDDPRVMQYVRQRLLDERLARHLAAEVEWLRWRIL